MSTSTRELANGTKVTTLHCDGWCEGRNRVTHIGSKGYAYCTDCAAWVRGGGENVRRCAAWEIRLMLAGKTLPSYTPISKAEATARGIL